jgi:hypothetical protein
MTNTIYDTVNDLPDMSMVAGETKELTFNLYDELGIPLDLTGNTFFWGLLEYNHTVHEQYVTEKFVTILPTCNVTLNLSYLDTLYLSGKYIQQCFIMYTDNNGKTVCYAHQGNVIIFPTFPD